MCQTDPIQRPPSDSRCLQPTQQNATGLRSLDHQLAHVAGERRDAAIFPLAEHPAGHGHGEVSPTSQLTLAPAHPTQYRASTSDLDDYLQRRERRRRLFDERNISAAPPPPVVRRAEQPPSMPPTADPAPQAAPPHTTTAPPPAGAATATDPAQHARPLAHPTAGAAPEIARCVTPAVDARQHGAALGRLPLPLCLGGLQSADSRHVIRHLIIQRRRIDIRCRQPSERPRPSPPVR